jgi:hypothetical protein
MIVLYTSCITSLRVLVIPIVVVVVQFAEVLVMMSSVKLLGSILTSFRWLVAHCIVDTE